LINDCPIILTRNSSNYSISLNARFFECAACEVCRCGNSTPQSKEKGLLALRSWLTVAARLYVPKAPREVFTF